MKYIKIFEEFVISTKRVVEAATAFSKQTDTVSLSLKPTYLIKMKEKLGVGAEEEISAEKIKEFQRENNIDETGILNHSTVLTAMKGDAPTEEPTVETVDDSQLGENPIPEQTV